MHNKGSTIPFALSISWVLWREVDVSTSVMSPRWNSSIESMYIESAHLQHEYRQKSMWPQMTPSKLRPGQTTASSWNHYARFEGCYTGNSMNQKMHPKSLNKLSHHFQSAANDLIIVYYLLVKQQRGIQVIETPPNCSSSTKRWPLQQRVCRFGRKAVNKGLICIVKQRYTKLSFKNFKRFWIYLGAARTWRL